MRLVSKGLGGCDFAPKRLALASKAIALALALLKRFGGGAKRFLVGVASAWRKRLESALGLARKRFGRRHKCFEALLKYFLGLA